MTTKSGYLGVMLHEVLVGRGKTTSISPTDFVFDLHHATVTLEEHLSDWGKSGNPKEVNLSRKLTPIISQLREATADKYAVIFDD